jgi:hypothetical protein
LLPPLPEDPAAPVLSLLLPACPEPLLAELPPDDEDELALDELALEDVLPPEVPADPDELESPVHPPEISPSINVVVRAAAWTFMKSLLPTETNEGGACGQNGFTDLSFCDPT